MLMVLRDIVVTLRQQSVERLVADSNNFRLVDLAKI
jgi:hypothetical protein